MTEREEAGHGRRETGDVVHAGAADSLPVFDLRDAGSFAASVVWKRHALLRSVVAERAAAERLKVKGAGSAGRRATPDLRDAGSFAVSVVWERHALLRSVVAERAAAERKGK